jgi:hypothetical protein
MTSTELLVKNLRNDLNMEEIKVKMTDQIDMDQRKDLDANGLNMGGRQERVEK